MEGPWFGMAYGTEMLGLLPSTSGRREERGKGSGQWDRIMEAMSLSTMIMGELHAQTKDLGTKHHCVILVFEMTSIGPPLDGDSPLDSYAEGHPSAC